MLTLHIGSISCPEALVDSTARMMTLQLGLRDKQDSDCNRFVPQIISRRLAPVYPGGADNVYRFPPTAKPSKVSLSVVITCAAQPDPESHTRSEYGLQSQVAVSGEGGNLRPQIWTGACPDMSRVVRFQNIIWAAFVYPSLGLWLEKLSIAPP